MSINVRDIPCFNSDCQKKGIMMLPSGGSFSSKLSIYNFRCPKCKNECFIVPKEKGNDYTISMTTEKQREDARLAPERAQKPHIQARTRGIGKDYCTCFMCKDGEKKLMHNIAMFVNSKLEGEAIVQHFQYGAWLDYRENEPNWIQVKVGACNSHYDLLAQLDHVISIHQTVSRAMVDEIRESVVAVP